MGHPDSIGLKAKVGEALAKNEHSAIVSDEPDKLYTCSVHIKNEAKAKVHYFYLGTFLVKKIIEISNDFR